LTTPPGLNFYPKTAKNFFTIFAIFPKFVNPPPSPIGRCLEKLQLPLSSLNAAFNANSKMVNYISVALTVPKWHKNYHKQQTNDYMYLLGDYNSKK
jgi:hypothetical protein